MRFGKPPKAVWYINTSHTCINVASLSSLLLDGFEWIMGGGGNRLKVRKILFCTKK